MVVERGSIFGSYRAEIKAILDEFNEACRGIFIVDDRVLIPAENSYQLDKRGIIVEYHGDLNSFEEQFQQYTKELERLAHKLDKRTSLYEYPFKSEFCSLDKWNDWGELKVAYNYEL